MKHKIKEMVPAHEIEKVEKTTCDLCGEKICVKGWNVENVDLYYRKGTQYPETGWGEKWTPDLCGRCFETKLIPWFESQRSEEEEPIPWTEWHS